MCEWYECFARTDHKSITFEARCFTYMYDDKTNSKYKVNCLITVCWSAHNNVMTVWVVTQTCTHACTHTQTWAHTHKLTNTCSHTHKLTEITHTHTSSHTHKLTHTHAHTHTHTHTHTAWEVTHTCTHTHKHTQARTHTHTLACRHTH